MLTVMYRDEWGNESLHEATSVQYFPAHGKMNPIMSGHDCEPGVLVNLLGGTSVHFGTQKACSSDQVPREIFVMNEKGATVARYGL